MKKRISSHRLTHGRINLSGKRIFLIISFLFLFGMFIGALLVKTDGAKASVSAVFSEYFVNKRDGTVSGLMISSLLSSLAFVAAAFFSGLFLLGAPVAAAVAIFRGMGIGLFAGFVYAQYALQGVGFYVLVMLIPLFISSVGIIYACDRAFYMSMKLLSVSLPNVKIFRLNTEIIDYIKSFVPVMIVIIFSAVLDTVMSLMFVQLFSF